MKTVLTLAILALSTSVFADDTVFPNDTHTGVLSQGADCDAIRVTSAYYTLFNDSGGAGKALVIQVDIRNDAFDKSISERKANGEWERAVNSANWNENFVSIAYQSQRDGHDQATIVDQRVGAEDSGTYDLKLEMNGQAYTCSNIQVGPN